MTDQTIHTILPGVYLKKGFLLLTGGFPCRKHTYINLPPGALLVNRLKSNIPPFYLHYHNFHTPIIDVTKWASVYEETLPQSLPIYRPISGIIRRLLLNLIAVASISRLSAVSRRL